MSDAEVCDSVGKDIQREISDKLSAAKEWGSKLSVVFLNLCRRLFIFKSREVQ